MSHVIILSLKKFLVNFKFILILKQQKSPGGSGSQTVDYYQNVIKRFVLQNSSLSLAS